MIVTQVFCDFCNKPIPEDIFVDPFGEDCTCVRNNKTKEFDTSDLYPHMCESCAKKIDEILVAYRAEMIHHVDVVLRSSE